MTTIQKELGLNDEELKKIVESIFKGRENK